MTIHDDDPDTLIAAVDDALAAVAAEPHHLQLGPHLTNLDAVGAQLRAAGKRVGHADDYRLHLLWRHHDVKRALADTDSYSNTLTLAPIYQPCDEAIAVLTQLDVPPTTAAADPPTHTRTRAVLRAIFPNTGPKVADQWGRLVGWRVDGMLADLWTHTPGQPFDLLPHLNRLPVRVICNLLGVHPDDVAKVQAWADGQIALVWGRPGPAEQVRLAQGLLDFWLYCRELTRDRAAAGGYGDDIISRALRFRGGDNTVLTLPEVASIAFNLLVAGHETTAGLLAHTIHRALSEPGRWPKLADDHAEVTALVEDTLRDRPPIDGWLRLTRRDIHYGRQTIPANSRVLLLIREAQQDPAGNGELLSFGHGPHYCIGAALARLEATVAVGRLAQAMPDLALAGAVPPYRPNAAFRAHQSLPVRNR